ncbi:nwd2 [Moniliophthora roreri]|uniref:Nephrocystin 3-like N-terminal domain-containing protein n=1 Tax=Moniliophthora roreri TaxID=221103 RepID=A0A0W0G7W0_MONRR|nr:nwd2 [Moniliophthora roreri]
MSFESCSRFTINGNVVNRVEGDQITTTTIYNGTVGTSTGYGLQILAHNVASNALHDAEQGHPPPKCHPGTRVRILEFMSNWIMDGSKAKRVYWLNGPVGVGKTAIAQTLADRFQGTHLAASFFFSRTDSTRNNLRLFVTTLAYQIATSTALGPLLGPAIDDALRNKQTIIHSALERQFELLIRLPCGALDPERWKSLPRAIFIDGLDECVDIPSQERLLSMLSSAYTTDPPFPFDIVLCCRAEPLVADAFKHPALSAISTQMSIGKSFHSDRDIEIFFRSRFKEIRFRHYRTMQKVPENWPEEEAIQELVRRSCGQFVYATTVIKYIDNLQSVPTVRLGAILESRVLKGKSLYPELDLLYRQVLQSCEDVDAVSCILFWIIHHGNIAASDAEAGRLFIPTCWVIGQVLDMEPATVRAHLFSLHSVLHVPDHSDHNIIKVLHASFTEFLRDAERSQQYCVKEFDMTFCHDFITQCLLRRIASFLSQYREAVGKIRSSAPTPFRFSIPSLSYDDQELYTRFNDWNEGPKSGHKFMDAFDSLELVAALDEFDPYSYVTMTLHGNRCGPHKNQYHPDSPAAKISVWQQRLLHFDCQLNTLRDVVSWTKSLDKFPIAFIDKCRALCNHFQVGFPTTTDVEATDAIISGLKFSLASADLDIVTIEKEIGTNLVYELLFHYHVEMQVSFFREGAASPTSKQAVVIMPCSRFLEHTKSVEAEQLSRNCSPSFKNSLSSILHTNICYVDLQQGRMDCLRRPLAIIPSESLLSRLRQISRKAVAQTKPISEHYVAGYSLHKPLPRRTLLADHSSWITSPADIHFRLTKCAEHTWLYYLTRLPDDDELIELLKSRKDTFPHSAFEGQVPLYNAQIALDWFNAPPKSQLHQHAELLTSLTMCNRERSLDLSASASSTSVAQSVT